MALSAILFTSLHRKEVEEIRSSCFIIYWQTALTTVEHHMVIIMAEKSPYIGPDCKRNGPAVPIPSWVITSGKKGSSICHSSYLFFGLTNLHFCFTTNQWSFSLVKKLSSIISLWTTTAQFKVKLQVWIKQTLKLPSQGTPHTGLRTILDKVQNLPQYIRLRLGLPGARRSNSTYLMTK